MQVEIDAEVELAFKDLLVKLSTQPDAQCLLKVAKEQVSYELSHSTNDLWQVIRIVHERMEQLLKAAVLH